MNRNAIIKHIELYKSKLGSFANVARKVGISEASLSTLMAGKYGANENNMLQRIAKELNYKESNWQLVRTTYDYRKIEAVVKDAKNESMWFALSENAGAGKSEPLEDIFNQDKTGSIVFIQCEEWSARQFLIKLIERVIGTEPLKKYKTIAQLTDIIVGFFNDMSFSQPVLIIDEADKLRPAALRTLIPLYNRTENRLGVILSGTENLEKEVKQGVRLHKKGFDELESRFGRTYIHLRGANENEVFQICAANGITSLDRQQQIWSRLKKTEKYVPVKQPNKTVKDTLVSFVEDKRLIKRLIKTELLNNRK
jgi:DNA transposition AAA+ family ATPase